MNKILLINPPITMKETYNSLASVAGIDPPLNLIHLASVTREKGYETKILDAPALNFDRK